MQSHGSHGNSEWDEPEGPAWDADDPRRQKDQFAPPTEPCECFCLHCHRTFMSDGIWLQKINGGRKELDGFWMCPTPNCNGKGFTFDIFPTDPTHPANEGWCDDDGDEEDAEGLWEDDDDDEEFEFEAFDEEDEKEFEYDPAEPHYQMMDDFAGEDDDLDGEEWKHGLAPGERPDPDKPQWLIEEEKRYDEPDRRPRELDWTDAELSEHGTMNDDDIPF